MKTGPIVLKPLQSAIVLRYPSGMFVAFGSIDPINRDGPSRYPLATEAYRAHNFQTVEKANEYLRDEHKGGDILEICELRFVALPVKKEIIK